jgi:hypothetical protein
MRPEKNSVVRYHGRRMPLNSTRAFESEHDRLLEKLQQLREAAKPFVALQHYFEHGHTGGNDPLTITRDDLRKLAEAVK